MNKNVIIINKEKKKCNKMRCVLQLDDSFKKRREKIQKQDI